MKSIYETILPFVIITLAITLLSAVPASGAYDVPDNWETLRPLIEVLKAHGVQFDGSAADLSALLERLSRRAGIAAAEAEKTGFDALFNVPEAQISGDETEVIEGGSADYERKLYTNFTTRTFWFQPLEYSNPPPDEDHELRRIPVRQYLYFRMDAKNYIDDPDEAMEKASDYVRSGEYEGSIDRELAKRVLAEIKYDEDLIEFDKEEGLIPTYELPYDSELKFEGRK
ncbi:MAG: hypothetical protein GY771_05955, partial [bacterium]|nr:hypothetical protein [bacterium]